MKLTLEESDLKPEYQNNRSAQEDVSSEMFNDNAINALRLVHLATFVSTDGKIQKSIYLPK